MPAETGLPVAVLVFANQSGDPTQVLSYGAVLPFRDRNLPPQEIGRALRARYIVGGTVRRMGPRVRVTVQLSDAMTGMQLWSEQ